MAKRLVVTDGQDPLTKPILDYLDAWYGIPHGDIRAITLESATGDVQLVTVTLLVHARTAPGLVVTPPNLTDAEAEEFKRSWRERFEHGGNASGVVFGPSPDYDPKDPG
jgi:hypothetical protein